MAMDEILQAFDTLVGGTDAPVVAFSAAWPFMRAVGGDRAAVPTKIKDALIEAIGPHRTLAMPSFARGFQDGFCDLDTEPSTTGSITEVFRQDPRTRRTLSAFFAFNVMGPDTDELISLCPEHAWGDGSFYEWSEQKEAIYLMMGTHPTHNSYLHRMEWLRKEAVKYRYVKEFTGRVRHEDQEFDLTENLFVRGLDPEVNTEFTFMLDDLMQEGIQIERPCGIQITAARTSVMKKVFLARLDADPYCCCVDRDQIAAHFSGENNG